MSENSFRMAAMAVGKTGGPRRRSSSFDSRTALVVTCMVILAGLNLVSIHKNVLILNPAYETEYIAVEASEKLLLPISPATVTFTKNTGHPARNTDNISEPVDIQQAPGNSSEAVLIWTYPGPPKGKPFPFDSAATMLCSYSKACEELLGNAKVSYKPINLRILTQGGPFEGFAGGHMYYKFLHGTNYPHHIQSVTVCSYLMQGKTVIGVPLQPAQLADWKAKCNNYDPTDSKSTPPIQIGFVEKAAFAAMGYDSSVKTTKVANSDDEVQSMTAAQFLPYVSTRVDRDKGLPGIPSSPSPHFIGNAWYGTGSAFPPPPPWKSQAISFVAAHFVGATRPQMLTKLMAYWKKDNKEAGAISGAARPQMRTHHLAYWEKYNEEVGAIGALDLATLELLKLFGLKAYLSLCLTLMYQIPRPDDAPPRDSIFIIGVDPSHLPKDVLEQGEFIEWNVPSDQRNSHLDRHRYAFELLQAYALRAKVVITSRIHSALPALALGASVIFVEATGLQGAEGISDLFHLYRPGLDEWTFDVTQSLGPAPGVHKIDRYRASFWNHLKRSSIFYEETARLYGMIPMQRYGKGLTASEELHNLFHFVFTTDPSRMSWKSVRAIENVFFHHPDAKVVVHSNTLYNNRGKLDVFVESGYDLEVRPFDLMRMLRQVYSEDELDGFRGRLPALEQGQHWYSHKSDILRYLFIYLEGGVYLDIDVFLLRPIPSNQTNILGKQDSIYVNGAAMIFELKHPILKTALDFVVGNYTDENMEIWPIIGPRLITWLVGNAAPTQTRPVTVLDVEAFQPFQYQHVGNRCFEQQSNYTLNNSIAIHLNNMVTSNYVATKPGTLCDRILHEYCILCDEVHTQ